MSSHRMMHDMFRAFDANGPGRINDPGDAGTITPTQWGQICGMTTEGASETRTLSAPTKPGVLFALVHDTDGGDVDVTVTDGYNRDGATGINFADAKDYVVFYSIEAGGSYYWRAIAQEGTDAAVEEGDFDSLSIGGTAITSTATELNQLDGAVLATMSPGSGTTAAVGQYAATVTKAPNGLYKTEILIDITGLNEGGTAADIIGDAGGVANCHIGQITAAVNGTIIAGRVHCLEVPAGGDVDLDFYAGDLGTGAQDANIDTADSGSATALLDHGNWSANEIDELTGLPLADEYLYIATGAGTTLNDDDYTGGIFLIELWGV